MNIACDSLDATHPRSITYGVMVVGSSVTETMSAPVFGVATGVSADTLLGLGLGLELGLIIRIVALLPITEGCGPPS